MTNFAPDAFTLWFNCNQDQKTHGAYWAAADVPIEEIEKLYNWALQQDPIRNDKGQPCVQMRASLRPKTSRSGNDYLLLAVSDQKVKAATSNRLPF